MEAKAGFGFCGSGREEERCVNRWKNAHGREKVRARGLEMTSKRAVECFDLAIHDLVSGLRVQALWDDVPHRPGCAENGEWPIIPTPRIYPRKTRIIDYGSA